MSVSLGVEWPKGSRFWKRGEPHQSVAGKEVNRCGLPCRLLFYMKASPVRHLLRSALAANYVFWASCDCRFLRLASNQISLNLVDLFQ